MATIKMDIEGMHCGGCATGIQMVTEQLDEVDKSFVDLDTKKGTFEVKDGAEGVEQKIIGAITELGYTATVTT